jgi:hypothetical protein
MPVGLLFGYAASPADGRLSFFKVRGTAYERQRSLALGGRGRDKQQLCPSVCLTTVPTCRRPFASSPSRKSGFSTGTESRIHIRFYIARRNRSALHSELTHPPRQ